jgi:hypothetical protein
VPTRYLALSRNINSLLALIKPCPCRRQKPAGTGIYEGACDFITELVLNKPLNQSYLIYGRENEQGLKAQFKKEMNGDNFSNWLYNGTTTKNLNEATIYFKLVDSVHKLVGSLHKSVDSYHKSDGGFHKSHGSFHNLLVRSHNSFSVKT